MRVAQAVQDVGDGAVAARDDDAIEGADVGDRILRLHAVSDEAHADLVAAHREGAREREDLVGARAGREGVDDEDAHVFPVRAKPSIVIVSTILPSVRGAANHHG